MRERNPGRLPAEWLPGQVAPAADGNDAEWEQRLRRLMIAAEPALAELARTADSPTPARIASPRLPWWSVLAAGWKPTLALATAAAAAMLGGFWLLPGPQRPPAPSPTAFTLTTVAGGGEPASLWQGLGASADPVLAQIVLHGGSR